MSLAPLKVLIADDSPINVKQLEVLVQRLGHLTVIAHDGIEAVEAYRRESPDLVFMDIMMPGMDGLEAVQEIRGQAADKWCPIIFYSSLDHMQDIVRGLECGGDDYLVKPASIPLLRAKINGYARLLGLQREIRDYSSELENWRAQAEEQNRLGAHIMARLTDAAGLRDPMLRHFNIPAETFSGDLLCAGRAPGGVMNVMLADAAGHGLSAALSAMPLTQAFYSMTAKGFPLSSIAQELNRKLKAILPADRFIAATLASVDVRNQTVEVWNGGNPEAIFINAAGVVCHRWSSRHPPLGILPDAQFSSATETIEFHEQGELVLCSDGLMEAEGPDGAWLGQEGLLKLLDIGARRGGVIERLLDGVYKHIQADAGRDDISCMLVHVPIERRRQIRVSAPSQAERVWVGDWRLDLAYSARELRYIDVVPAVLGFITQVGALRAHQGALFLIVSELFNNALDHGLLGLDSGIKDELGGFDLYMEQRQERLSCLEQGGITMSFHLHQQDARVVLDVLMQDSGPGFKHEQGPPREHALEVDNRAHGRGIALVRSLCSEVVYSGTGNKVWVRYVLGEPRADNDEAGVGAEG